MQAKSWDVTQHDNGNLIYMNGIELVYMVINPDDGTIAYYRKSDIETFKVFCSLEEIEENDLNNPTGLVDYLMKKNDWSDHSNRINIINLLDGQAF